MNKEYFLKNFTNKENANKIYNYISLAINNDTAIITNEFFTPDIWKKLNNKICGVYVYPLYVFDKEDRKQILLSPYEISNIEDYKNNDKICITINNKFKEYKHKDFLGSIMALNIKRELLSELIIRDNKAYFAISSNMTNILLNELMYISNVKCKIDIIDNFENIYKEYITFDISISSNRLDNIIKSIANISREKAIYMIESSLVSIDYNIIKDKSYYVEDDSIITIKTYGKYRLVNKIKESKKNKKVYKIDKAI